jgi:hypothetical protein
MFNMSRWVFKYRNNLYLAQVEEKKLTIQTVAVQEIKKFKSKNLVEPNSTQILHVVSVISSSHSELVENLKFSYPTLGQSVEQSFAIAVPRLLNIKLLGQNQRDTSQQITDTVICFGTFDLFHDLHRRLLSSAMSISRHRLIIFIWSQHIKKGIQLSDLVQDRISAVTSYLCKLHSDFAHVEISVQRMTQKHKPELISAIQKYKPMGSVTLFGGADQFEDYPEVLDICYDSKVEIVTVDRGHGLCSTDLRTLKTYKDSATKYNLAISDQIWQSQSLYSLWKANPQSVKQAQNYLCRTTYLGCNEGEIWKYEQELEFDSKITHPITSPTRSIVCLPGRTRCNLERSRKILRTIKDMMRGRGQPLDCYLFTYRDDEHTTGYYTDNLKANPNGYFSLDALLLTRIFLLPRVSSVIRVNSKGKLIVKPDQKDNFEEIRLRLSDLTFWGRSRGSVITWEIENAFRFCLQQLSYTETEIKLLSQQVVCCNISNLIDPTADRLFSTVSVTSVTDGKAKEYISTDYLSQLGLTQSSRCFTNYPHCYLRSLSKTNFMVLAKVPNQILTYDNSQGLEGHFNRLVTVTDEKCHYTPLFLAPRYGTKANYLSEWINQTFFNLVNRQRYFTLDSCYPSLYSITHKIESYPVYNY